MLRTRRGRGCRLLLSLVLGAGFVIVPLGTVLSNSAAASALVSVSSYPAPLISKPTAIATGSDGALWFGNTADLSIGRLTTSGALTNYPAVGAVHGMTVGPDGALWFTGGAWVGRITTSGDVDYYGVGSLSTTSGITVGPDGALWFTDAGNDEIGRITTSGLITTFTDPKISEPTVITEGPDGALWFANHNFTIGRIDTSGTVTAFSVPTAFIYGITTGPDGALWFTNQGFQDSIDRMTTDGTVTTYLDSDYSAPVGITAGPDGNLWFTNSGNASIGMITTSGTISQFGPAGTSSPTGITVGPDAALWFTNNGNNSIGRIATSGAATRFTSMISRPRGITAGPDGAMWFANHDNSTIGRIDVTGAITHFDDPNIVTPDGIAAGPDNALWFTNNLGDSIGRITTAGEVTNYTDPSIANPTGITVGPDNALWFTNNLGNSIGRITTAGEVTNYTDPSIRNPADITVGPDGALWFTNKGNNSIGRITITGTIANFNARGIAAPEEITAGPDGALWFAEGLVHGIGRITTAGVVTAYTSSQVGIPVGITRGPDGALWFTSGGNDEIGRITTSGAITMYTGSPPGSPDIAAPSSIARGPDGALWFTNGTSIGRITTPAGLVSDPPTDLVATPKNASAAVSFTPPANNGGSAITSYTVTCMSPDGGATGSGSGATSPIVVGGLTNGTTYTCTVRATNAVGVSVPSSPSNHFVPAPTVPDPPSGLVTTSANGSASVAFTPPPNNGGSAITSYTVTCMSPDGGATGSGSGATSPIVVGGLTNGTTYTCTVTATNSLGPSAASVPSTSFIPTRCSGSCVSVGDASLYEGDVATHVMHFPVTLSRPATSTVTVNYAVVGSTVSGFTATGGTKLAPGVDFKIKTGTLKWTPSATTGLTGISKTIGVTVYGDTAAESDETFAVILSSPSGGGFVLGGSQGTGTIRNDDISSGIIMGIGDASIVNATAGKQNLMLGVTLSAKATSTVRVTYAITSVTATFSAKSTGGGDYGGKTSGVLTFDVGTGGFTPNVKTLTIPIWPDVNADTNETFTVTLSNLSGAGITLIDNSATGTILAS